MGIEDNEHRRAAELAAKLGRRVTPADFTGQPAAPEPVAEQPEASQPPRRRGRPPRAREGTQE